MTVPTPKLIPAFWRLFLPMLQYRQSRASVTAGRNFGSGTIIFDNNGITLLLVVVLLSAILSIGVGIFNVVVGELKISGEAADSFRALYAADQGIERILYLDRQEQAFCTLAQGPNCFVQRDVAVQSEGCYSVRISKTSGITEIVIAGQYRCGPNPARVVKRGFQIIY